MATISEKWETEHAFDIIPETTPDEFPDVDCDVPADTASDDPDIWQVHPDDEVECTDEPGVEIPDFNPSDEDINQMLDLTDEDVLGMTFASETDCIAFYTHLGKISGFGVRLDNVRRNRNEEAIWRSICCTRQGYRQQKHLQRAPGPRGFRDETRCGCSARIIFSYKKKEKIWKVTKFSRDHNHDLLGGYLVHLHRCFRRMDNAVKEQARSLQRSGLKSAQVFTILAEQMGGYHKAGFTSKDLANLNAADQRELLRQGDINRALDYLRAKQSIDPLCKLKYTKDNADRLLLCRK